MASLLRRNIFHLPTTTLLNSRAIVKTTRVNLLHNMATSSSSSDTSKQVHRTTLFKIPDANNIQSVLEKYSTLAQDAKKNGKPYILRCVAGPAVHDARSQGYTLAAQTTFASIEDMRFYDEGCEAHAALKAVAKGKVEAPPLMVCFDSAVGV